MNKTKAAACGAALLLALPGLASAKASAQASLSGFSYSLIDLNPGDNIAPALVFDYQQSYSYASASGNNVWSDENGWGLPTSAADASAGRSAAGATDGQGGASASFMSTVATQTQSYGQIYGGFTLTPWTALVLSADFAGQASTTVGYNGSASEYASAYGSVQVSVYQDNGWEYHYSTRQAYASYAWDGNQYVGQSTQFAGSFSVAYANLSNDSVSGYMAGYAQTYGQGLAQPVPEPATAALLMAGVLAVGGLARRRQRRD